MICCFECTVLECTRGGSNRPGSFGGQLEACTGCAAARGANTAPLSSLKSSLKLTLYTLSSRPRLAYLTPLLALTACAGKQGPGRQPYQPFYTALCFSLRFLPFLFFMCVCLLGACALSFCVSVIGWGHAFGLCD